MDEETFDYQLSRLIECFPGVDFELLAEAVLEAEGVEQDAVDHVLARTIDVPSGLVPESEASAAVKELMISFPAVPVDTLAAFVAAHPDDEDVDVLTNELILHLQSQPEAWKADRTLKRPRRVVITQQVFATDTSPALPPSRHGAWCNSAATSSDGLYMAILEFLEGHLKDVPNGLNREDPQKLREAAFEVHQARAVLYGRAAEAHQRGGMTGSGSAQYYSSQAQSMKKTMDQLNWRAAYWTFRNLCVPAAFRLIHS